MNNLCEGKTFHPAPDNPQGIRGVWVDQGCKVLFFFEERTKGRGKQPHEARQLQYNIIKPRP